LAYCYDDARVIKFLWNLTTTRHAHSFED
jgi:hypothetical protein